MDSLVINKIETKAMEVALLQGQTPFALYRPIKGIPVLVKVLSTANNKHVSMYIMDIISYRKHMYGEKVKKIYKIKL